MLSQDTTHLIQGPCYQRESPCQDPAGNWTTRRPPDDCKETQTAVVWSCLPLIRSCQNHLARHSERGKKTKQKDEEVGRQHQGMDRPGVRHLPEGSGEQGKMEETGCEIICGAPTTLAVKGEMTMMMMSILVAGVYRASEEERFSRTRQAKETTPRELELAVRSADLVSQLAGALSRVSHKGRTKSGLETNANTSPTYFAQKTWNRKILQNRKN